MKRIWLLLATLGWSGPAAAQHYQVGQHVEAYSPMAGRWVSGTIARLDGDRYMFQADDHSLANDYWGVTPDQLRPVGAAAAGPAAPGGAGPVGTAAPPRAPDPQLPQAQPQAQAGNCGAADGGPATVRIAGTHPAPLGGGIFPNGSPLGTPGQTNYLNNRNGQRSIVAVAPPGLGSPIGRFNLMVGGTWSTASIRDLGGGVSERILEWNVPARANVLLINADHSWYRKSGSTRLSGRWIDLGQNVVQLIGYDGDDWTGSIQRWNDGICRMEMRGPLGQNEWGRRF